MNLYRSLLFSLFGVSRSIDSVCVCVWSGRFFFYLFLLLLFLLATQFNTQPTWMALLSDYYHYSGSLSHLSHRGRNDASWRGHWWIHYRNPDRLNWTSDESVDSHAARGTSIDVQPGIDWNGKCEISDKAKPKREREREIRRKKKKCFYAMRCRVVASRFCGSLQKWSYLNADSCQPRWGSCQPLKITSSSSSLLFFFLSLCRFTSFPSHSFFLSFYLLEQNGGCQRNQWPIGWIRGESSGNEANRTWSGD